MKIKKENPICPKCGSKNIIARIVKKDFWCRRCGYIGKRGAFFKNVGEVKLDEKRLRI